MRCRNCKFEIDWTGDVWKHLRKTKICKEAAPDLPEIVRAWYRTELEARRAELKAVEDGTWPRNINDSFRWSAPTNQFNSAAENRRISREHAAAMCRREIEYYESKLK